MNIVSQVKIAVLCFYSFLILYKPLDLWHQRFCTLFCDIRLIKIHNISSDKCIPKPEITTLLWKKDTFLFWSWCAKSQSLWCRHPKASTVALRRSGSPQRTLAAWTQLQTHRFTCYFFFFFNLIWGQTMKFIHESARIYELHKCRCVGV